MDKRREGSITSSSSKDSGHVLDIRGLGAYDEAEMHSLADAAAEYVPSVQVRGV